MCYIELNIRSIEVDIYNTRSTHIAWVLSNWWRSRKVRTYEAHEYFVKWHNYAIKLCNLNINSFILKIITSLQSCSYISCTRMNTNTHIVIFIKIYNHNCYMIVKSQKNNEIWIYMHSMWKNMDLIFLSNFQLQNLTGCHSQTTLYNSTKNTLHKYGLE